MFQFRFMKFRPLKYLLTAFFLVCLYAVTVGILAQGKQQLSPEILAVLQMPDGPAKIDSIIATALKNRRNIAIDTLFTVGFNLIRELEHTAAEARMLDAFGVYKRDLSRYDEALESHLKSLELAKKSSDLKTEIKANNNIGVVFRRLDENGRALSYHITALGLAEKTGDDFSASVALNSIGNIHIALKNYKDAIEYFRQGLVISERAGNNLGIAMNYNNIGEAYEFTGNMDSAHYYYKLSLHYNELINDSRGIAINYNSIGNVLRQQGQLATATELFKKAKTITDTLGDQLYRVNNYNNLGNAFLQQGLYDSSRKMFVSAVGIAKDIRTLSELRSAYDGLSHLYEREGKLDSALVYLKLSKLYNDSIIAENNNRHVRQMEAIYAIDKVKGRMDALQEKEQIKNRDQRIFFLGTLALFLLVLASGILYYLRYRLIERNRHLQKELDIRTQIASDLHDDMGSSLSSIHIFSELLRNADGSKEQLLGKIEENARHTLDALDDIIWLVKPANDKFSNLWQHIREYALPMFQSKDIAYAIDFPETLAGIPLLMDVRRNVFLIIKECVNNLVKYSNCSEASIVAQDEEGVIAFAVKDNGKGFDPDQLTDRNGVKNIQARAKSIGAEIKITTACGKGTLVEFWVKKNREQEKQK